MTANRVLILFSTLALAAAGAACDAPSAAKRPASKKPASSQPVEGETTPGGPEGPGGPGGAADPADGPKDGPSHNDPTPAIPQDPNAQKRPPAPPVGGLPPLTTRCAVRLSVALAGKSPDGALLRATDHAATVDSLVRTPDFVERYARFINSEMNSAPATSAAEDPVYFLAKHVIGNDKPWSDLFLGSYQVKASGDTMKVTDDTKGLGYFRSDAWKKRYAGNEPQGYMLVGAFRILQNTTGLELSASVGMPDDDRTTNGRQAAGCKGCHFDAWYALDKVARLLPKATRQEEAISFTPPNEGPQQLFGKSIADDKALVEALVDSDAWRFQQCRLVFKFLYGRSENKCDAPTFDRCVDALSQTKTIRAAVAAVAKDPGACL